MKQLKDDNKNNLSLLKTRVITREDYQEEFSDDGEIPGGDSVSDLTKKPLTEDKIIVLELDIGRTGYYLINYSELNTLIDKIDEIFNPYKK